MLNRLITLINMNLKALSTKAGERGGRGGGEIPEARTG